MGARRVKKHPRHTQQLYPPQNRPVLHPCLSFPFGGKTDRGFSCCANAPSGQGRAHLWHTPLSTHQPFVKAPSMIRNIPFVPTAADIDTLRGEVLEAAQHGMKPLYMLDAFGMGYPIGSHEDFDHEAYPWHWAQRYVAADNEGTVCWIHPQVRAALDTLTAEDFTTVLAASPWVSGSTKRAAHQTLRHHQDALAALDARMPPAQRLLDAILALPPATSAQEAYSALLDAAAASGLHESTAWQVIALALGVDPDLCLPTGFGIASHLHAVAARIPDGVPAPSAQAAKEAYLDIMPPYTATKHAAIARHTALLTAATALARGLYPVPVRDLDQHPDYICARAQRKRSHPDHDPRHDRDCYKDVAEAIGRMIEARKARPEDIEGMIARANTALAKMGEERTLTRGVCQDIYEEQTHIPF